jgi:hypothetical protein
VTLHARGVAFTHSRPYHPQTCGVRHNSRLHHIGIGRRHAGTTVLILVHDQHVRIITSSGQLLRDFQLDPNRDYQPQPAT